MVNVTRVNDVINVEIEGLINEEIRLPKLDLKGAKKVVFDFDKVDAINSIGVKMWIGFLMDIPRGMPTAYKNCRRVVVDQMNMVAGFRPLYFDVESFYVPYMCDTCVTIVPALYQLEREYESMGKIRHPEKVMCPKCNVPTKMDVIEAKYFRFILRK